MLSHVLVILNTRSRASASSHVFLSTQNTYSTIYAEAFLDCSLRDSLQSCENPVAILVDHGNWLGTMVMLAISFTQGVSLQTSLSMFHQLISFPNSDNLHSHDSWTLFHVLARFPFHGFLNNYEGKVHQCSL